MECRRLVVFLSSCSSAVPAALEDSSPLQPQLPWTPPVFKNSPKPRKRPLPPPPPLLLSLFSSLSFQPDSFGSWGLLIVGGGTSGFPDKKRSLLFSFTADFANERLTPISRRKKVFPFFFSDLKKKKKRIGLYRVFSLGVKLRLLQG